jgi:acyl-homoserine lactone synthase
VIYVVDKTNRSAFEPQLDDMFRIRHDIYVVRRGWSALAKPDGRDIDQFDTDETVYLLGIDDTGKVTAGLRLNPTTGPHLIKDLFPHAVTKRDIPVSEGIYEFTRWFVVKDRVDPTANRRLAGELLAAMFEYGITHGLTHFTLLCDSFFLRTMRELHWDVNTLGEPTKYDEGTAIAVIFPASVKNLINTREARGISQPVLVKFPMPIPSPANDNSTIEAA